MHLFGVSKSQDIPFTLYKFTIKSKFQHCKLKQVYNKFSYICIFQIHTRHSIYLIQHNIQAYNGLGMPSLLSLCTHSLKLKMKFKRICCSLNPYREKSLIITKSSTTLVSLALDGTSTDRGSLFHQ